MRDSGMLGFRTQNALCSKLPIENIRFVVDQNTVHVKSQPEFRIFRIVDSQPAEYTSGGAACRQGLANIPFIRGEKKRRAVRRDIRERVPAVQEGHSDNRQAVILNGSQHPHA